MQHIPTLSLVVETSNAKNKTKTANLKNFSSDLLNRLRLNVVLKCGPLCLGKIIISLTEDDIFSCFIILKTKSRR